MNMELAGSLVLRAALFLLALGLTGARADTFKGKKSFGAGFGGPGPGGAGGGGGTWELLCWHPSFQLGKPPPSPSLLLLLRGFLSEFVGTRTSKVALFRHVTAVDFGTVQLSNRSAFTFCPVLFYEPKLTD